MQATCAARSQDLGVAYPVALDNDYAIWRAFNNRYWPAHYFIDADGRIRGHHFGEGEYDESERLIRRLLQDAGQTNLPPPVSAVAGDGVQSAADDDNVASPETYVGYGRAGEFQLARRIRARCAEGSTPLPGDLQRNQWALAGPWTVSPENARLDAAGGRITFRFHARDLHLVLGPGEGRQARPLSRDARRPGARKGSAASTSTRTAKASFASSACISSSASRATCATARSPSNSSMPAREAFAFTFG